MGHARLGVSHGRGRVAFDRTEVALAFNEDLAHRPRLRHVDEGRVNHGLAMRMIVTARVAANLRALVGFAAGIKRELLHRIEDAALRRL